MLGGKPGSCNHFSFLYFCSVSQVLDTGVALEEGVMRYFLPHFHTVNHSLFLTVLPHPNSKECRPICLPKRNKRAALKGRAGQDHTFKITSNAAGLVAPKTLPTPLGTVESEAASSIRML